MAKEAPKKSEEPKAKTAAPIAEAAAPASKTEATGAVATPVASAVPTTAAEALAEGEVAKKVVKAKHSKNVFQGIAHIMAISRAR